MSRRRHRRPLRRGSLLAAAAVAVLLALGSASVVMAVTGHHGQPPKRPSASGPSDPTAAALAGPSPQQSTLSPTPRPSRPKRHRRPPATPPPASSGICTSSPATFAVGSRTWPNCADTGVPAGTALRQLISPAPTGDGDDTVTEIHQSGTVIKDVELTGSLDVYANNVTIEDSVIKSRNWWGINLRQGYTNLRILHCTIVGLPGQGPDNGYENYGVSSSGNAVEVGWSNISGFGDAISMGTGNVHDNYVHDLQSFIAANSTEYNHDDDVISNGGSGLTVTHNTLLDQLTPNQGASSAIGLYDDFGEITNVSITDNFLAGGAYTLYPASSPSAHIVITGNVFSSLYWSASGFYGPVDTGDWDTSGVGNEWSGNTLAKGTQAGKPVSHG